MRENKSRKQGQSEEGEKRKTKKSGEREKQR